MSEQCARTSWSQRWSHQVKLSGGYTLLELLIVGVLISVLMAGIWSLFRNWSRLYTRGERRVVQLQLLRSLCDQFTDDVHASAQAPPVAVNRSAPQTGGTPAPDSSPSTGASHAALVGGSDWLILEIVAPAAPWPSGDEETAEEGGMSIAADDSRDSDRVVSDVRRVVYTFAPPDQDEGDSLSSLVEEMAKADDTELVVEEAAQAAPFSGLLRLAVGWDTPLLSAGAAESGAGATSSGSRSDAFRLREAVVGTGATSEAEPWSPVDAMPSATMELNSSPLTADPAGFAAESEPLAGILERDEVPEVIWFELRYYDGASWQTSWDSQAQGRLPVAVEMRFELQVADPHADEVDEPVLSEGGERELVGERQTPAEEAADLRDELSSGSTPTDEISALGGGESKETPYYRCVVFLQAKEGR